MSIIANLGVLFASKVLSYYSAKLKTTPTDSDENAKKKKKTDMKGNMLIQGSSGDDWHLIDQPFTNDLSGAKEVLQFLDTLTLNQTVTVY